MNKRGIFVIACVWWYFSRHHIFSPYHFHQIDLVMSSCSLISFWLAVKIIVSPTIFSMKIEEKKHAATLAHFLFNVYYLYVLNSHVKNPNKHSFKWNVWLFWILLGKWITHSLVFVQCELWIVYYSHIHKPW